MNDPYQVLGVSPNAGDDEIKQKYGYMTTVEIAIKDTKKINNLNINEKYGKVIRDNI